MANLNHLLMELSKAKVDLDAATIRIATSTTVEMANNATNARREVRRRIAFLAEQILREVDY